MNQRLTTTAAVIFIGFSLGFCSRPAPADEVEDRTDRAWQQYQQDSDRYRERLEADQRQQERTISCYLAGQDSAMCKGFGDYQRRQVEDRRGK